MSRAGAPSSASVSLPSQMSRPYPSTSIKNKTANDLENVAMENDTVQNQKQNHNQPTRKRPRFVMPSLPAPGSYSRLYSSYKVEWEERRKSIPIHVDITCLESLQIASSLYLVACTSLGQLIVWDVDLSEGGSHNFYNENDKDGNLVENDDAARLFRSSSASSSSPCAKLQISSKSLTACAVLCEQDRAKDGDTLNAAGSNASPARNLVLVGGTEGLWLFDWNEIFELHKKTERQRLAVKKAFNSENHKILSKPILQVQAYSPMQKETKPAPENDTDWTVLILEDLTGIIHHMKFQHLDAGAKGTSGPRACLHTTCQVEIRGATSIACYSNEDTTKQTGTELSKSSPVVLVGTSNSEICTWNPSAAKKKSHATSVGERLCLYSASEQMKDPGGFSSNGPSEQAMQRKKKYPLVVKGIFITNDCWWTIGGEIRRRYTDRYHSSSSQNHHGKNNRKDKTSNSTDWHSMNGFISTWHGPTRTCVAFLETREIIQGLLSPTSSIAEYFSRNGFKNYIGTGSNIVGSFGHDGSFYSIGNEGLVSVWNSPHDIMSNNARTHRIWTSPPSSLAITSLMATTKATTTTAATDKYEAPKIIVAVAGVGPKIDLLQNSCRIQTLNVYAGTNTPSPEKTTTKNVSTQQQDRV